MNIQEGSYYIARNGELVGPMEVSAKENVSIGSPWYSPGKAVYRDDGTHGYFDHYCPALDITDTVDDAARKHVEGN